MFYKIMISKKEGEFKEEEVKELFKDFSLIEEAPNEQADNKVKTVYIKLNDKNKKNCLDSIINEENTKSVYSIKKNMVLKLPEEIQQITNVTSQQNNVIKLANNGAVGYSVPIRRDEKGNNRLFVGSVSSETNNTLLTILFSQFGEVKEIDRQGNLKNNGCCFITMDSEESCKKAIIGLNKKISLGCNNEITVEFAKNKIKNNKKQRHQIKDNSIDTTNYQKQLLPVSRFLQTIQNLATINTENTNCIATPNDIRVNNRLFVGQIDSKIDDIILMTLFSQFGEVKEIDRKSNLQTNGCCFITMDSNESCVKAIIGLNKKIPLGCKSTITVELAKNMSRNTGNNRQALPCYQTFLNNKANTATRNINSKFQSAPGKPLTDDSDDDLFILSSSNEQKSYFNSDNVPKVVKTKPSHRL